MSDERITAKTDFVQLHPVDDRHELWGYDAEGDLAPGRPLARFGSDVDVSGLHRDEIAAALGVHPSRLDNTYEDGLPVIGWIDEGPAWRVLPGTVWETTTRKGE